MKEKELNNYVEEYKNECSGSDDYLSGINDGAFGVLRRILETHKLVKNNVDLADVMVMLNKIDSKINEIKENTKPFNTLGCAG